jgi:hypothetical protein
VPSRSGDLGARVREHPLAALGVALAVCTVAIVLAVYTAAGPDQRSNVAGINATGLPTGAGTYPAPVSSADSGALDTGPLDSGPVDSGVPTADSTEPAPTVQDSPPTATEEASGYTVYQGPGDISVPIPSGWAVHAGVVPSNEQADDPNVPGRFIRFGADEMNAGNAVAAVSRSESMTPTIRPGYRRLRLRPVAFGPDGDAADWEFTFTKDGRTRHAYGRYWRQNGLLYVVYLSTWQDDWAASAGVLQFLLTRSSAP